MRWSQLSEWNVIVNCNNAQPERFNSLNPQSISELRTSNCWRRLRPSWTSIASPLTGGLGHWQQDFANLCCSAWLEIIHHDVIMISWWYHHDCIMIGIEKLLVTAGMWSLVQRITLWSFGISTATSFGHILDTARKFCALAWREYVLKCSKFLDLGVRFHLTHTVLLYVATGCYRLLHV